MRLQSSQQNRKYKTINTASYHIVIQSTSFLYYNVAWKGGSFTFPFYPLWIVSICFRQTPPTHFIKIKWAKDLSFCHTKRRKKRRFSSSEIVPLFSKTMDERTKNLSYFVCSSTANTNSNKKNSYSLSNCLMFFCILSNLNYLLWELFKG